VYNPVIKMGVELEVEFFGDPDYLFQHVIDEQIIGVHGIQQGHIYVRHGKLIAKILDVGANFLSVGYDRSLVDGIEIRGEPASIEINKKAWIPLLEDSYISKYILGDTATTAGMHVHMSGDPISPLTLAKMVKFIVHNDNKTLIKIIAGRYHETGSTGVYFSDNEKHLTSASVVYVYHSKSCRKFPNKKFATGGISGNFVEMKTCPCRPLKWIRRSAINVIPSHDSGLCEIRMFQSTTKPQKFMANLEFCVALVEFCHEKTMQELTSRNFLKWLEQAHNKIKYSNLFKSLRESNIVEGLIPRRETYKEWIVKREVKVKTFQTVR